MDTTFILANACSATISLNDMPYTQGFISITSPFGTPIKIANFLGTVDYTVPTSVPFVHAITPPYTPADGTVQAGVYEIIVYNAANTAESTTYTPTLGSTGKLPATIAIAYTQDCNTNTATFNFTSDIPVNATGISYLWTISDPNNVTTTETTSQIVIDPTISGTYTVILAVTYTVSVATQDGSETFLTRTATTSTSYTKSCGNAQSLICDIMYCCIKTALYKFIGEPTWGNGADLLAKLAAGFLMQLSINCNRQQDAQIILNELNTKYDCHACGDCSGCK